MSAPRPHVTDPFRPLSSIPRQLQVLYIQIRVLLISYIWYDQMCLDKVQIGQLSMRCCRNTHFNVQSRFQSCFVPRGACWVTLLQKVGIYARAFAEQTKQSIISCHPIKVSLIFFSVLFFCFDCLFAGLFLKQIYLFSISSSRHAKSIEVVLYRVDVKLTKKQ